MSDETLVGENAPELAVLPSDAIVAPVAEPTAADLIASGTYTVRSAVHLDDLADTGLSYRPGDVIVGWTSERVLRMVDAGIVTIV